MSAPLALWGNACYRSACIACQSRKQKCDREWPCDRCSRRKMPERCQYDQPSSSGDNELQSMITLEPSFSKPSQPPRKWKLEAQDGELDKDDASMGDMSDEETAFKFIGYTPSSFANLSEPTKPYSLRGYADDQAHVVRAMEVLPPLPHLETLLQSFTETLNYYYYIIHPPGLMEAYRIWRDELRLGRPLNPAMVALMLRVCVCVIPFLRPDVRRKIEAELKISIQSLANRCNEAAIELSGKIPTGQGGLLHVQQLLLTSYWHSSERRFFDCWHALGAAVGEAQAIGLDKESKADGLSDLDRKMRRSTWCILYTWDWQISTLFSRPQFVNRHGGDPISLELYLEGDDAPSPIYQMKLQFEAIQMVSLRFGDLSRPMGASVVREFEKTIDKWTASFPPILRINDPDISMDKDNMWITLHRQYLHVMTYTMMLLPLRRNLCRAFGHDERQVDQDIRASAIECCLKLRDAHLLLFHTTYPFGAKYHLAQFSLTDLGLVLCSAMIQDRYRNIPKRNEVIGVISDVLAMLRVHPHNTVTDKPSMAYRIIFKLIKRLPISKDELKTIRRHEINVKFEHTPELRTRPTTESWSPQPIVVPLRASAVAKLDQAGPSVSQMMNSADGPLTPISIDEEPTSFKPEFPEESPDTLLPDFDSEIHPHHDHDHEPANMRLSATSESDNDSNDLDPEHEYSQPLERSDYDHHTALTCISAKPVLDVFLERFLDSYGPEMPSSWQPMHWIHAGEPYRIWRIGAAARSSSLLLSNSFTAVSVAYFGRSISDMGIVSAADRMYSSILRTLQAAICHPEDSMSDAVLWSIVLCAVYEGVSRTGDNGFLTHLLGILKLLEFRGADRHTEGVAHGLFAELRCYFVFAAITTRRPTFLAHPAWKYVPWSTGSTQKDLLHHVLDHMCDIPALLAYVDQIKSGFGIKSAVEMDRLQQELYNLATDIEQRLYQWKQEWADQYLGGPTSEVLLQTEDALPNFQCRHPITGEIVETPMLVYPDPVLAQAMCHYFAALMLVYLADTRERDPALPDIYSLACLICRSMGYYALLVPSGLASRVAFPFRLAYDNLPKGGIERRYIEQVFKVIASRRFSQEWESTLDGVSVGN